MITLHDIHTIGVQKYVRVSTRKYNIKITSLPSLHTVVVNCKYKNFQVYPIHRDERFFYIHYVFK